MVRRRGTQDGFSVIDSKGYNTVDLKKLSLNNKLKPKLEVILRIVVKYSVAYVLRGLVLNILNTL